MTQRQQITYRTIAVPPHPDNASIHRVARRIFSRHLNEGDPITWEQAKVDAERAWWEVNSMASDRKVAS